MKRAPSSALLLGVLVPFAVAWEGQSPEDSNARTITRVVKLLESMLDQSKQEGDSDRELYATYKCYCDTQEASHKESIKTLTKAIGELENEIDALQGSNGELSADSGKLKFDMAENEKARSTAQDIRDKAHDEFIADRDDMSGAISQLTQAIDVLTDIGADQNLVEGADHTKFMASFKRNRTPLVQLKSKIKAALLAASTLLPPKRQRSVESFLQAPFTGTYTAQSAEVLGILRDMRVTFDSNLQSANATEAAQVKAHGAYMKAKLDEWNDMDAAYSKNQEEMASNDNTLSTKRSQLNTAKNDLADDKDFLAKLIPLCAEKAKRYEERNMLRKSEEAALAEAIAILNSDAAFVTFGKVDATLRGPTQGTFLQLSSVRKRVPKAEVSLVQRAQKLLQSGRSSPRISRVLALLEAENPFAVVLKEIESMLKLLKEEGDADQSKLNWCTTERDASNSRLNQLSGLLVLLDKQIADLEDSIYNPETGMEALIATEEDNLKRNREDQVSQTLQRTKENQAYQKDVAALVDSQDLLRRAIEVLDQYYSSLKEHSSGTVFLQGMSEDDPQPPPLFNGTFVGQSASGTDAISMLTFIKTNAKKEEDTAHGNENAAQRAFEDSMATLTQQEKGAQARLATMRSELANVHLNLLGKQEDHKKATDQKHAVMAYLADIKPGCDFISNSIDERNGNRGTERLALIEARSLILETQHYKDSVRDALHASWGACHDICVTDSEHAECKACLAEVTVPAYCAGHPDTKGCGDSS